MKKILLGVLKILFFPIICGLKGDREFHNVNLMLICGALGSLSVVIAKICFALGFDITFWCNVIGVCILLFVYSMIGCIVEFIKYFVFEKH